jgi:hypothetical protein
MRAITAAESVQKIPGVREHAHWISHARNLAVVLTVLWSARLAYIWWTWGIGRSVDLGSWNQVSHALAEGRNPYTTGLLNWPPFWMQVIYGLGQLQDSTGVPLTLLIQLLLTTAESVLVVFLYQLLRELRPGNSPVRLLLVGIALNPICILLTCQHGNFDVFVGLTVVAFLTVLLRWERLRNVLDWLWACALLGAAVAVKTVPLVLAPLVLLGSSRLAFRAKFLGGLMIVAPAALGMAVLYPLDPGSIQKHVLGYRSFCGSTGLSGIIACFGGVDEKELALVYGRIFIAVAVLVLAWCAYRMARLEALSPRALVLLSALLLLGIPIVGPGMGMQYIYWSLPLLLVSYACYDSEWRKLLGLSYAVAAATYVICYATEVPLGHVLTQALPGIAWAQRVHECIWTRTDEMKYPMWGCGLILLIGGGARVRRDMLTERRQGSR